MPTKFKPPVLLLNAQTSRIPTEIYPQGTHTVMLCLDNTLYLNYQELDLRLVSHEMSLTDVFNAILRFATIFYWKHRKPLVLFLSRDMEPLLAPDIAPVALSGINTGPQQCMVMPIIPE